MIDKEGANMYHLLSKVLENECYSKKSDQNIR